RKGLSRAGRGAPPSDESPPKDFIPVARSSVVTCPLATRAGDFRSANVRRSATKLWQFPDFSGTHVTGIRRKSFHFKRGRRDSNPQPPDRQASNPSSRSAQKPRELQAFYRVATAMQALHFRTNARKFLRKFRGSAASCGRSAEEMSSAAGPSLQQPA